jgi:hypothetical protein
VLYGVVQAIVCAPRKLALRLVNQRFREHALAVEFAPATQHLAEVIQVAIANVPHHVHACLIAQPAISRFAASDEVVLESKSRRVDAALHRPVWSWSSMAFASFKSAQSKPSVNQP